MRRDDREVKERATIIEIIKKADTCRLALVDGDLPYIVAMNFGFKEGNPDVLYFHCANAGKKLDIIEKNNTVCFQMDVDHELITAKKACGFTMNFKSIVGMGKVFKAESKQEKINGLNCIMKQYSDWDQYSYEDKMLDITTILKLEISEMSAKQKE